jgi:hypothetical protein
MPWSTCSLFSHNQLFFEHAILVGVRKIGENDTYKISLLDLIELKMMNVLVHLKFKIMYIIILVSCFCFPWLMMTMRRWMK